MRAGVPSLTVLPLRDLEALLDSTQGNRQEGGRLVPPLLVTDEDTAVLLDGADPRLCPRCLLDGIERSRLQRHRGPGSRCAGALDGWGPVIDLAEQLTALPLEPAGPFPRVRVLSRDNLEVCTVPVIPSERCPHRHHVPAGQIRQRLDEDLARPAGPAYRAVPLEQVAADVEGLANPFCSGLGLEAVQDLGIETTAKVSGVYLNRTAEGCWTSPWGGHTSRFSQSRAIGLLESLERIAGSLPSSGTRTWTGTFQDTPVPAYPPSAFGLHSRADLVPTRWVAATRLADGVEVAVPRDVAYYLSEQTEQLVQDSSNGCACGGSLAEAILYGLLEVVERDAFLIGWYGALPLEEIDPSSIRTCSSRNLLARMRLLGYRVRFFDSTVGTRIPTVTAVAECGTTGSLCFGAGAHPDAERALASALSEVASDYQVARIRLERGRRRIESMLADFSRVEVMEDHADLFTHPGARPLAAFLLDAPQVRLRDLETLSVPGAGNDVATDLRLCLELLDPGLDVLVVEQTLPAQAALGVHSVKVLMPGLVPIDFGWHRQRALSMARTRRCAEHFRSHRRPGISSRIPVPVPHPFP